MTELERWMNDHPPLADALTAEETGFGKGGVDLYRLLFADGLDRPGIRPEYPDDGNPGYFHLSAYRYGFGAGIYILRFIFHPLPYRKRTIERNLLLSFQIS